MEIIVTANNQKIINNFNCAIIDYRNIDNLRFNLAKRNEIEKLVNSILHLREYLAPKIMLDIPMPYEKVRVFGNKLENNIIEGDIYYFKLKRSECGINDFYVDISFENYDVFRNCCGEVIYGDGEGTFEMLGYTLNSLKIKAKNSFVLMSGKAIYFGSLINTAKKNEDINLFRDIIHELKPDNIALSFVHGKNDIDELKKSLNINTMITSKIEEKNGIRNISEISLTSDYVMIARGDAGVCCPIHQIGYLQDYLIREIKKNSGKIYIATDILMSLKKRLLPSRSDVIDITTMIKADIDGVILPAGILNYDYAVDFIRKIEKDGGNVYV